MACQKVAAGGVIVLGQLTDPVLADGFGRGGRGGDEGLARTRGGYVADQGARAAKMKSAPGPGTTDLGYSTTPHPTKGVRPRARCV